eukprot:m.136491 g.136491  ORF g.136491 m.136491 type:complete len:167 (-) comp9902_c0_seq3:522-1022(-)
MTNVLHPMPENLTKEIRFFAKCLEPWVRSAMEGYPAPLIDRRLQRVTIVARKLRRYTSLNHLAGAARPVLTSADQTEKMLADFASLDFVSIHEQAGRICGCEQHVVSTYHGEFRDALGNTSGLEHWARWLQKVGLTTAVTRHVPSSHMSENTRSSASLLVTMRFLH